MKKKIIYSFISLFVLFWIVKWVSAWWQDYANLCPIDPQIVTDQQIDILATDWDVVTTNKWNNLVCDVYYIFAERLTPLEWHQVPTTDTASYDINCSRRVNYDSATWAGYYYPTIITSNKLSGPWTWKEPNGTFVTFIIEIPSNSKSSVIYPFMKVKSDLSLELGATSWIDSGSTSSILWLEKACSHVHPR